MDLAQHFAFTFYLQIMKKGGELTSELEPLTPARYEFACARSSLYWCVRKLRIFGWFSVLLTRLFVHRVLACTSQVAVRVAVNPWEKKLIAYPCSSRVIIERCRGLAYGHPRSLRAIRLALLRRRRRTADCRNRKILSNCMRTRG